MIIKNEKILKLKIDKNVVTNSGIWPYIISELTLLSLSNPNEIIKLFFFPEIKAKYYPIIVFIIFALFNNLIVDLEVFSGIFYAFFYHFLIKNKLKISKKLIKNLENNGFIKCFMKFGGFISIKEDKFSSFDNDNSKKERNVVIINNLRDYENFQKSDTNINIDINTNSINLTEKDNNDNKNEQNKKELNDTLDNKIQK